MVNYLEPNRVITPATTTTMPLCHRDLIHLETKTKKEKEKEKQDV